MQDTDPHAILSQLGVAGLRCAVVVLSLGCGGKAPVAPPATDAAVQAVPMVGVTVVQQHGNVEYGWKADHPPDEPDSPEVVLVRRTVGAEWTVVERLPSRPSSLAVAADGTVAMVLQSSEHLDELRVGKTQLSSGALPELPVRDAMVWRDPAPSGAQRLTYTGTELDGSTRTVWVVAHDGGWVVDPNRDDCGALTPLPDEERVQRVTWRGTEGQVRAHQDLNGDGDNEYILVESSSCGTGGCSTPILQSCGPVTGGYRVIGNPEAWGEITVLQTRTDGWLDVQFEARGKPGDTVAEIRKYTYPDPVYTGQ